jgi:hypothetical protein
MVIEFSQILVCICWNDHVIFYLSLW